jgi:8-oxo-dGTP diphosphatase
MGGFTNHNESTDEAAVRVLGQLTGMDNIYMEQLYCFSDVNRDPAGRVISIAYFALINIEEYNEQMQSEHEAKWFPLDKIPDLIFDHKDMVAKA